MVINYGNLFWSADHLLRFFGLIDLFKIIRSTKEFSVGNMFDINYYLVLSNRLFSSYQCFTHLHEFHPLKKRHK